MIQQLIPDDLSIDTRCFSTCLRSTHLPNNLQPVLPIPRSSLDSAPPLDRVPDNVSLISELLLIQHYRSGSRMRLDDHLTLGLHRRRGTRLVRTIRQAGHRKECTAYG